MSVVKIQGNASGTGIFTVAAPNSNTNYTLTLPTASGTFLTNSGTEAGAFSTLSVNGNNISAVNGFWRNRIINGGMVIDQRNAGASVTVNTSPVFSVDRFYCAANASGVYTAQRSTTAPAGFTNSVILTVTTPRTSIAAGDVYGIRQAIEGFNTADLGWGGASAQSVTLSFWVRSSITGTYTVSFFNAAFNRSYVATYTINAANTFEQKTITIAGDTTGTWATDNTAGITVYWDLGSGSTYNGTAGAWSASGILRTSGSTNWISTNGATFYLTGVQLEAGTVASPFERVDYSRQLIQCQRYFARVFDPPMRGVGTGGTSGGASRLALFFPTTMRAQPTVSINGTFNFWNGSATATGTVLDGYFIGGYNGIDLDITTSASFTIGQAVCAYCTNNTTTKYVNLDAEL